ncbi:MAG: hypothetical protein RTU30_05635 [Candidatus Thorarchaeota archaeon]
MTTPLRNLLSRSRLGMLLNITLIVFLILFFYSGNTLLAEGERVSTESNIIAGDAVGGTTGQVVEVNSFTTTNEVTILDETVALQEMEYFALPLYDYNDITITSTIESTVTENITLHVDLEYFEFNYQINVKGAVENVSSYSPSLAMERAHTNDWICDSSIWFTSSEDDEAVIRTIQFVLTATSNETLCPVTIDIQSTEEYSLFENPLTTEMAYPVVLNLTQTTGSHSFGYVIPRQADMIVYLVPGSYSGEAYWARTNMRNTSWSEIIPVSFTIAEDEQASVSVKLTTIRLAMDVSPRLPRLYVKVGFDELILYDIGPISAALPHDIYIPGANRNLTVQVDTQQIDDPEEEVRILVDGTEDLVFEKEYDYLTVFGITLTLLELQVLIFGVALLIIFMIRIALMMHVTYLKRTWIDPRIIPLALLIISYFLPWFMTTTTRYGLEQYDALWAPLSLTLTWTEGSLMQPIAMSFQLQTLVFTFLAIWAPLAIAIVHIGSPRSWAMDKTFSYLMIPNFALAFAGGLLARIQIPNLQFTTGSFIAMGTPIVWLLLTEVWKRARGLTAEGYDSRKSVTDAIEYVPVVISALNLAEDVAARTVEILDFAKDKKIEWEDYDPVGYAAATVYLACLEICPDRDESEIIMATGVESIRLRGIFRAISNALDEYLQ